MIKTTYICDKCKAQQDTSDQMWNIAVRCTHSPYSYVATDYQQPTMRALWCRKCADEFQLIATRRDILPEAKPGLEDLLRELIREEIQWQIPNPR